MLLFHVEIRCVAPGKHAAPQRAGHVTASCLVVAEDHTSAVATAQTALLDQRFIPVSLGPVRTVNPSAIGADDPLRERVGEALEAGLSIALLEAGSEGPTTLK